MKIFNYVWLGIIIILIFILGVFCADRLIPFNAVQIAGLVSYQSPKSNEMNIRFEKLYKKFGNDKKIPHIFVEGSLFSWQEIYDNIDYLIKE